MASMAEGHPITRDELREELQHYATKADVASLETRMVKWIAGFVMLGGRHRRGRAHRRRREGRGRLGDASRLDAETVALSALPAPWTGRSRPHPAPPTRPFGRVPSFSFPQRGKGLRCSSTKAWRSHRGTDANCASSRCARGGERRLTPARLCFYRPLSMPQHSTTALSGANNPGPSSSEPCI